MTAQVHVIAGPTMQERQEHVERARQVMSRPHVHTKRVVREAAQVLRAWGDMTDQIMCDAVIFQIEKDEWDEIDRRLFDMDDSARKYRDATRRMNLMAWLVLACAVTLLLGIVATVLWGL